LTNPASPTPQPAIVHEMHLERMLLECIGNGSVSCQDSVQMLLS